MTAILRGTGKLEILRGCAAQTTDSYAALSGSEMDARPWRTLSYTLAVLTNDVNWEVFGADASDYSGEVVVMAEATVTASASDTFTTSMAMYGYYRVKVKSAAGSTPGDVSLYGIATG